MAFFKKNNKNKAKKETERRVMDKEFEEAAPAADNTAEPDAGNISGQNNQPLDKQEDFQKLVEELQVKNSELNDKFLRLYSDFDNFRKRANRERTELYKYAGEEIISLLLPIIDDFERALKSVEKAQDIQAVKEGVELIYDKMKNVLKQQGLKEMEILNGEFNSDFHNAITKIAAPSEEQKGKIIDIIEKGYYLNDKVIRHAKVVVGS